MISKELTLFLILILGFNVGCFNLSKKEQLAQNPNEIQVGGTKIIPIETAKGKFNIWTKRIGNNPKVKILLLAGGPGCTHEYFECFESFLPTEDIEMI